MDDNDEKKKVSTTSSVDIKEWGKQFFFPNFSLLVCVSIYIIRIFI